MRWSVLAVSVLTLNGVVAFAPSSVSFCATSRTTSASSTSSTKVDLFGGGGAKTDGDTQKKGPGMMDQLAMFKKAQEMAQKKKKMDDDLAAANYEGTAADGKVKVVCKFVPSKNPMMDPNPDIDPVSFEFDDEWFEAASPEELSAAVQEAITDGVDKTNAAMMKTYSALQEDFAKAFSTGDDASA
jgi:DNA-binding protein YbaB